MKFGNDLNEIDGDTAVEESGIMRLAQAEAEATEGRYFHRVILAERRPGRREAGP